MKKTLFLALCLIALSPLRLMAEVVPANDSRVTYVGRTWVDGTDVSFDWTATYFRIAFSGKSLTMKASETKWDATPEKAATRHNYYAVWIDSPTSAEPHRIIEVAGNDTVIELVDPAIAIPVVMVWMHQAAKSASRQRQKTHRAPMLLSYRAISMQTTCRSLTRVWVSHATIIRSSRDGGCLIAISKPSTRILPN